MDKETETWVNFVIRIKAQNIAHIVRWVGAGPVFYPAIEVDGVSYSRDQGPDGVNVVVVS